MKPIKIQMTIAKNLKLFKLIFSQVQEHFLDIVWSIIQ